MLAFSVLQGISPWWWVAFALVLGALEMLSLAFFLIGPAIAALIMSFLLVIFPAMPATIQLASFGVIAVLLTFGFQLQRHRLQPGEGAANGLNDRRAQMLGRQGTVIRFHHGHGTIEIDGIHWQARAHPDALGLRAGVSVEVEGIEGDALRVRRLGPET